MAILVGPIREDFNISDKQYGLLNGVAFTFLYVILGIPIAWLADRKSRKNIIAIGTAFWSLMTFLCGLATGFYSFFIARMGVGLGEAALSPPAHSLLSDTFSQQKLPTVMAMFTLGIPLGIGISYSLGGWVYAWVDAQQRLMLPMLGEIKPWQATFMIVGAPGLLLAALIFCLSEPKRTGVVISQNFDKMPTVAQSLAYICAHKTVYLSIFVAISALSMIGYSFMMWFVAHASRVYAIAEYEIGQSFGFLYMLFGVLGTLFGAAFSAYLARGGHCDAGLKVMLIVAILWLLPAIAVYFMPSLYLAYFLAAPCVFFLNAYFGVAIAAIQMITPNQMRAQISSILLFATNISGLLIGPVLVGSLSSDVFAGEYSLGYALATVAVIFAPIAIFSAPMSLKPYRKLHQQLASS